MKFLLSTFREILLFFSLVILFAVCNWGLQHFAPEAGVIDPSIFTVLLASLMKAAATALFSYLLLAVFFPTHADFIDSGAFRANFKTLTPDAKLRSTALVLGFLTLITLACVLFG